jgi:hypothetical protein
MTLPMLRNPSYLIPTFHAFLPSLHLTTRQTPKDDTNNQMAPQSQQIKDNFVNHPYTQKANQFLSGQVNQLDSEVRSPTLSITTRTTES